MDISKLLIQVANLSISASWLVLAVLVARLVLKRAPRWVHVTLWGIVGLRLVLPVSWESVLSLLPSQETIPPEIIYSPSPGIQSGVPMIDSFVNPVIQQQLAPNLAYTQAPTPMETLMTVGTIVWLVGMALMLGYTLFTYIRLRRRVTTAVRLEVNVYQSEFVASPFVLGLLRPRIYLPYGLEGEARTHVLAHEQAHIRRKDHWWKPLGFLLLTVYWFNPLLWVAYVLLCRDIELACDEKVVKKLDTRQRADYSQALLSCSVSRRSIAACPLAFGEVGVKQRIKSVLNYKKPAFWLILVAVIACIALAVGFLTSPKPEQNFDSPVQTDPPIQTDPFISTDSPAHTDPPISTNPDPPVQTDPPYQTEPPVPSVDNLTWAQTLRVEDVESVQVHYVGNGSQWYAQLTDTQIAEAVALIRECHGKRVPPELPPPPGSSVWFEVSTKDGVHVVSNGAGSHLFINEDCYEADHDWLAGWWEWSSIATNRVPGASEVRYTLQTYVPLYTLEELSAQVTLDSNGRLMIQDTDVWGPLLGQLYQAESVQLPDWALSGLPNLKKTCQELKDLVGKPGQLWICPYNYPTSGIVYLKLFLLYQTEDGTLYLGATKYQTGDKNDDQLLYLYELRMMMQSAEDPLTWAKNLKAEDITAMTLHVRGEYYRLEIGSSDFEKYLGYIQNAHGTRLDTMENAYAFDVTILVDTKDGMRHVVINDSGEKLLIDGYYYQADTDWLYSWWEEWRKS